MRAAPGGPPNALSEAQLRALFEQHRIDQFHKEAQVVASREVVELGQLLRADARERLDAYKWVAAIATAAFFFVGQAIGVGSVPVRAESVLGLLAAECGFLISIGAAGAYMFLVDARIAAWSRRMATFSSHTLTLLSGMEASARGLGDALGDTSAQADLARANDAFRETYETKVALGTHMGSANPGMPPQEGRLGSLLSLACVGGLAAGILAAAGHWLSRLSW